MKDFDIFLNNRLTECDVIVYSIPYRDGLTVMNRLILESCLESYILQKFVAVHFGSELGFVLTKARLNNGQYGRELPAQLFYTRTQDEEGFHEFIQNIKGRQFPHFHGYNPVS